MKTNPYARGLLRLRAIVLCLAIIGMTVAAFRAGDLLAGRFGQYTVVQTQSPLAANLNLGDLLASATGTR